MLMTELFNIFCPITRLTHIVSPTVFHFRGLLPVLSSVSAQLCLSSMENWLISLVCPSGTHEPVKLKHQTPVSIGRIPALQIVDPRCSRNQLQLMADCHRGEVTVTLQGGNSSALDDLEMIQNKEYKMKTTSTLYVLTGQYPQKLKMVELHKTHIKTEKDSGNDIVKTSKRDNKTEKTNDSSKHKSESSKTGTKRHSTSGHDEQQFKKPKVTFAGTVDKYDRRISEGDDEAHIKDVAAKLKVLKQSSKRIAPPSSTLSPKAKKTMRESPSPSPSTASTAKVAKAAKDLPTSSRSASVAGPALSSQWIEHDSIHVYTRKGLQSRAKVAAFDIDGTIIITQSGNVFPKDPGDWKLLFDKSIPKKIKDLHADGFKIVFITNQMGLSKGKTKLSDLKKKFEDIVDELEVPVQILVSTKGGQYRKPCVGMWRYLTEKGNDGIKIDIKRSLYIGDAAGRPKDWSKKKKKDFSSSDRLFALNIGLNFSTPEEYFQGYPTARFVMPDFDPREVSKSTPLFEHKNTQLCSVSQEIIVFVGYPASGKSFFVKKYLVPKQYVHINRDTLGTWQKCVAACRDAVERGKSVAIDNTNPDVESRARYVEVAKKNGVKCRCFVFNVSHTQARHNERFREITDKSHAAINDMVMNTYKSKYVPPEKKEGFSEVVKVNFVPKFNDTKLEDRYKMFLLEK